jgi:arsenical pump membrane protein
MLIAYSILAAIAIGAVALAPRGALAALIVVAAAALDVALGARAAPALAVVAPLAAFLTAALTLAALVERSGLAERAACALAERARGNAFALYALVCAVCVLLTAAISLDGAVVLMVPLLLALTRRFEAPFAPLFLGSVVVANAVSIAVPQGNPTNLVVMERLGLSAAEFTGHMLVPGLAAAVVCAAAVGYSERRGLRAAVQVPTGARTPLSRAERHAVTALAGAAAVAWAAPLLGLAPWWPFSGAVALALAARRSRLIVPWRLMAQVAGLVVVIQPLGLHPSVSGTLALPGLVAIAVGFGASSALANNLPVSVCAAGVLGSAAPAYAASIGLAVGSLATPQGSVATLIAADLAGPSAPRLRIRGFAPLAAAGVLTATLLLWAGL